MFQLQYFKIPRTLSRDYCARALQALEKVIKKPQQGIINLIVLDSEEMAHMNQQYRGKEGPTDILTFSYLNQEKKEKIKEKRGGFFWTQNSKLKTQNLVAWEIYLCLEKIKSYAKESGKTYEKQLEYIIVHGLVHLIGYDHETDADWKEMEKIEKKVQSLIEQ